MNAAGALKRAWKPVAQMVVLHFQGAGVSPVRGIATASTTSFISRAVVKNGFGQGRVGRAASAWKSSSILSSQVRFASGKSAALAKDEEEGEDHHQKEGEKEGAASGAKEGLVKSNYWGIASKAFLREDGTQWQWHCFKPEDTYEPDFTIDITKHHVPQNFEEKVALNFVKTMRLLVDTFFMKRYGCRAMMLETVAAVPGMVGGMLLHLRSLRRFEQSGGWIKALLDEAENERMHLMTLLEVVKPNWYERALVVLVQGVFFNCYFLFYLLSPRMAHRFTGYLEEEAIFSYTHFLKQIDLGNVENVPAPSIAIDYWRLPKDSRLRDVILALRADEAHHRDVNHFASDIRAEGKQLNQSPAPVGYK